MYFLFFNLRRFIFFLLKYLLSELIISSKIKKKLFGRGNNFHFDFIKHLDNKNILDKFIKMPLIILNNLNSIFKIN